MTLEEDITQNYRKFPASFFAEKYNKSISSIYTIASKLNVCYGPRRSEYLTEKILDLYYNEKKSISKIKEELKIGRSTIGSILKKKALGGRTPREAKKKEYNCKEDFFEKIDCHEKAYWYGFICADGNISNNKLQIGLAEKDRQHIDKFKKRIAYDGKTHNDKGNPKLIIARVKLVEDLKKLGLTENKTEFIDESCFDRIPQEFLRSAVLGYFDGDGSFGYGQDKGLTMNLVGNQKFLSWFCGYMRGLGIKFTQPKKDKRTNYTYYINKRIDLEVAEILIQNFYTDGSEDFLERKKERLLNEYERRLAKVSLQPKNDLF